MTAKFASHQVNSMPISASSPALSEVKAAKLERFRQGPQKPAVEFDKNELRKRLTPLQFRVTQEKHTERAFSGEYLKTNERGKFCCVVCNEELFSSDTKFDSGCGWPAFSSVINNNKIIAQADLSHVGGNLLLLALRSDLARTEVICANCGAHLGHVFDDGPKPTGKRYCVNSASLSFQSDSTKPFLNPTSPNSASSTVNSSTSTSSSTPASKATIPRSASSLTTCDYSPNGTCQMPPSATALICQQLVQQERKNQQSPPAVGNGVTSPTPTTVGKLNNSNTNTAQSTPVARSASATSPVISNISVSVQPPPKPKLRFIKRSASAAPTTNRKQQQQQSPQQQTTKQTSPASTITADRLFTTKPQNRVSRLMSRFACGTSKKDKALFSSDMNNNPKDEPILISVQNRKQAPVQPTFTQQPFDSVPSRYLDHLKPEAKQQVVSNTVNANRNLRAKFLESDL